MSGRILGFDGVRQGDWQASGFGVDGFKSVWTAGSAGQSSYTDYYSLPSYLSSCVVTANSSVYGASSTTPADRGGFWCPPLSGGSFTYTLWYHTSQIKIAITCTNSSPHMVSLYHYDLSNNGRRFRAEVWNASETVKLDEATITRGFFNPAVWTRIAYSESIVINLVNTAGVNCTLNGICFSPHVSSYSSGLHDRLVGNSLG